MKVRIAMFPTAAPWPCLVALAFSPGPLHAAAISWDGGGADDNWSTVNNWSDNASPVGDDLTFNNTDTRSNSTTINNIVSASITVNTLTYSQTDTGTELWHNTQINSGQTLTVGTSTVNVFRVGSAATSPDPNHNTRVTISGGGALAVNRSGGTVQIGGYSSGSAGSNSATLDMSNLATFSTNLGTTGTFRIGDNKADGSPGTGGASIVTLADTSTITTGTLTLGGDSGANYVQTLKLGSAQNTLNAATINVGAASASGARSRGDISFNDSTGTLKIRSAADTVNGRADMTLVGNGATGATSGTGGNLNSVVDLTGHSVDIRLGILNIASRSGGTAATSTAANSLFTFDTGTVDVNSVLLGQKLSGNSSTGAFANNRIDVGGGTFIVNTSIQLALNATTTGSVEAILNLAGGTHTLAATTMASGTASGGSASATINLTGGATTMTGSITRGTPTGSGTRTATVTLNGGSLNMGGFNLGGSGVNALSTLNLQSGALSNVGQINGGGAVSKTTAGTLTLAGTNTYTGATTISAGTLLVHGTHSSAGAYNVNAGTLGGAGSITTHNADVTVASGAFLSPGASTGTLTLTLGAGTLNLSGISTGALIFELGAIGASDQVVLNSGTLNIGTLNFNEFNFIPVAGITLGAYKLFDGALSTTLTGSIGASYGFFSGGQWGGYLWLDNANRDVMLTLDFTLVPEPNTLLLAALGAVGLGWRFRRLRRLPT